MNTLKKLLPKKKSKNVRTQVKTLKKIPFGQRSNKCLTGHVSYHKYKKGVVGISHV